ncbi:MAG: NAD-dependent epimerase/dehydratase family protein [Alphaproteobacteria bacterium]|nr:NAD-dependent epimerase/dehydratase family protein [Alphaproteobacteria bacterium]
MAIAVVTGAGGLIGAETAQLFSQRGLDVVGIDNDMRRRFFGAEASTRWQVAALERSCLRYRHVDADIRDDNALQQVFSRYGRNIEVIVHCAAQPSHDWAVREPVTDFTVNANGTLNLLEAARRHAPGAVFIFISTNKVYGDRPNRLPLIELETRFELAPEHEWAEHGIPEALPIDSCLHSLFGASKLAADILVQEYGRYFGLKTACFRGGCLTGPGHSGAQLHGFLAYLVKCAMTGTPYTIFGYKGKQVRDNIHSRDLAEAFWCFFQRPLAGQVFNIGGGRHANCSMVEAIAIAERLTGRRMQYEYDENNRVGDHIWWISDVRHFQSMYPEWSYEYDIEGIMSDIHAGLRERL